MGKDEFDMGHHSQNIMTVALDFLPLGNVYRNWPEIVFEVLDQISNEGKLGVDIGKKCHLIGTHRI